MPAKRKEGEDAREERVSGLTFQKKKKMKRREEKTHEGLYR
jgi:hypothetical protein